MAQRPTRWAQVDWHTCLGRYKIGWRKHIRIHIRTQGLENKRSTLPPWPSFTIKDNKNKKRESLLKLEEEKTNKTASRGWWSDPGNINNRSGPSVVWCGSRCLGPKPHVAYVSSIADLEIHWDGSKEAVRYGWGFSILFWFVGTTLQLAFCGNMTDILTAHYIRPNPSQIVPKMVPKKTRKWYKCKKNKTLNPCKFQDVMLRPNVMWVALSIFRRKDPVNDPPKYKGNPPPPNNVPSGTLLHDKIGSP